METAHGGAAEPAGAAGPGAGWAGPEQESASRGRSGANRMRRIYPAHPLPRLATALFGPAGWLSDFEAAALANGARLEASYPMSIPIHGQALNITCNSYAGQLCFGFTGCRDTLPSLQRMAVACTESLAEYESALGI